MADYTIKGRTKTGAVSRMKPRPILVSFVVLASMLMAAPSFAAHSGTTEARLPNGSIVGAKFHAGNRGRPAILILHGFLQTNEFPTVASLTDALATAGYTVLAPTLSLGISRRNKSPPCEAIHLHTLEGDTAEVGFWVRWLMQKGYSQVILVGHSFGNLQLLTYLGHEPAPVVKQALMISLTDVEVKQNASERAQLAEDMRNRVKRGDRTLVETEFGHCRKYVTPPAALLSYMGLSRSGILGALARSPVPTIAIMGGSDDRMGPDWIGRLSARGIEVRVIPGATHFFDNQYEFDLQDVVLRALSGR